MAGRNIKGITVEIGGDTTKLQTALEGVNSKIKTTQSQLRDVEKLLKLDPGNTELLAQKHKLLADAVSETKAKLETLETAAKQANDALAKGEISQEQYDALQREIIETKEELERLETAANQSATAIQKIAAQGEKLKTIGDNVSGVGEKFLPATAAVVGLGTAAVKTAADFDTGMSKVAAISGATGDDLDALRAKAREMGAKTKFSVSEAASAFEYMAMAGWKTEDMLDGIEGIMSLAAASGEDLATTSDIVTDALTAFGMSAQESGHFADILAAASSNANTNVAMMGETFKYAAPVAGALGYTAEDTALAIGLMANAGIKSSQAGTAIRSGLTRLVKPTKQVREAMEKYGISITDSNGRMYTLEEMMLQLREKLGGLSEAEQGAAAAAIFGTNAMSGWLAIINGSDEDFNKLSTAIDNCDGTSEQMAETMQDNLAGQLTILKSQLEELAISFGEILMPVIRKIVSAIQAFVDKLNKLSPATKEIITKIALVVVAIGPVLIVVGKIISAVGTIMTLVPKIAGAIKAVKGVFAGLNAVMAANPIILIIAAIAALVTAFIYLWNNCEEFREFWINLWEKVKTVAVAVWEAIKTFFSNAWEAIKTVAETVWGAISSFFSGLWQGISTTAATVWNAITEGLSNAWEAIKTVAETVFTAIAGFFLGIWQGISTTATNIWHGVTEGLSNAWNTIKTTAETVFKAIKEFISGIWEGITTAATNAWNGITEGLSNAWNTIKTTAETVFNAVSGFFSGIWEGISTTATNAWNGITEGLSNAWDGIKGTAETVWGAISGTVSTITDGISTAVQDKWSNIRSAYEEHGGGLKGIASATMEAVKGYFTLGFDALNNITGGKLDGLKNAVSNAVNAIKTNVSTAWNNIKTGIDTTLTNIKASVTTAWTNIKSTVSTLMQNVSTSVKSIWTNIHSGITGTLSNIVTSIRNGFTNAVDFVKNLASQAWNWGSDLVNGIVNGIKSAMGSLTSAVSDIAAKIRSFLHFSVPDEGPLADYESWMPDFMSGLASGIEKSRGIIKTAMSNVAGDMVFSPALAGAGANAGAVSGDSGIAELISAMRENLSKREDDAAGDITIPVYIGSERIEEIVVKANKAASYRSGGR